MVASSTMEIMAIIVFICEIALFLALSDFISRKLKKNFFVVAIIIWLVVFLINCIAVLMNVPIIIGFNVASRFDGGINGRYVSLGYGIKVEGHKLIGESNYDIQFISIKETFVIPKIDSNTENNSEWNSLKGINNTTNSTSNNSNNTEAEKKTLTGWKILTIDKGYYESETIEKDLDGDNVNETIDIKKTGKYITINGKDYITNKYYTGEDNTDSTNTSSQSMLLDEYNVNQYNFIDLNEDGVMEIIHRTFSMMISPIRSKYTIYNYVDNNLKEVGEFSIIGNMPDEVYVKNNFLKFEYDVYESNSKEEVKIELSV